MASDLMLMALIRLHARMSKEGNARILGTVHDSILFEVKHGYEDYWLPIIKETMEDMEYVRRTFGFEVTVPIIADIDTGSHWGETEAWAA
jgi:DNA polymerase I-like protein with 3'-5' exonuclease and polymerase domains